MFKRTYPEAREWFLSLGSAELDTDIDYQQWLDDRLSEHGDGKAFATWLTGEKPALSGADRRFLLDYIDAPNKHWKPSPAMSAKGAAKVQRNVAIRIDYRYLVEAEAYTQEMARGWLAIKYAVSEDTIKRVVQ